MVSILKNINIKKIKEILKAKLCRNDNTVYYDADLLEQLKSGNFENANIDVASWFNNQYYGYLKAAAKGCAINGDVDLFCQIFHVVDKGMNIDALELSRLYPNRMSALRAVKRHMKDSSSSVDDFTYEHLLDTLQHVICCECRLIFLDDLMDAMFVLNNNDDRFKTMFLMLSQFSDDTVRFVFERKVSLEREFMKRWQNYSATDKCSILFLTSGLENNTINYDIAFDSSDDFICFHGSIFENGTTSELHLDDFDGSIDKCDKRMIAEFLYQEIKNENVVLSGGKSFLNSVVGVLDESKRPKKKNKILYFRKKMTVFPEDQILESSLVIKIWLKRVF